MAAPTSINQPPLHALLQRTSSYLSTMQQAMPYRAWVPDSTTDVSGSSTIHQPPPHEGDAASVEKMITESAVIAFGRRGCCMCHVVKRLLLGLGVNPAVFEVDEEDEAAVVDELSRIVGVGGVNEGQIQFPAVFVGGKLFGGLERVMATHITGELVPILKQAGALWL